MLTDSICQQISAARLAGIQEDLSLSDTQYQTAVSILFVGYVSNTLFRDGVYI